MYVLQTWSHIGCMNRFVMLISSYCNVHNFVTVDLQLVLGADIHCMVVYFGYIVEEAIVSLVDHYY